MNTSILFRCKLTDLKIVAIYNAVANEAIRCTRCNGVAKLRANSLSYLITAVTDTSMPLSDKDGLRGRHCRPEKRRYQHRAIPVSRCCTASLFLVAEGQTYRASRVKRVCVETSRYIE